MNASAALIADYARDSANRGLQPTTIEMRTIRLRCFAEWLGKPIAEATAEDVERFLATRPIGSRTRYAWLSHISCFFRWGYRRGVLPVDPTVTIDRPRLKRLLPRPVADDALTSAIEAADPRMKAMLLLASHMGLRCCEIAAIHVNDVISTADQPMLVVHGKGDRERMLPIHPLVQAAMSPLPRRGWVFHSPDGRQLTPSRVSRTISLYLHYHGIDATAHQLRHWFGTRVYRGTRDLRLTQELMGHASPTTTAAYTAWASGEAADAVGNVAL